MVRENTLVTSRTHKTQVDVKSFFSRKKLALLENIESQFYESWYHLKLVVSLQLQPGDALLLAVLMVAVPRHPRYLKL